MPPDSTAQVELLYRAAARMVLVLHLMFTVVALFGGFALLMSLAMLWIHIPILLWAVAVNLFGWTCPLTPLEKKLWRTGGRPDYAGGFLIHYFGALLNLESASRRVEVTTALVLIAWNLVVYIVVLSVI